MTTLILLAVLGQQLHYVPKESPEPWQEYYVYDNGKPRVFQRYWLKTGWSSWKEHQLISDEEVNRTGSVVVRWGEVPNRATRDRLGITEWERIYDKERTWTKRNGKWDGRRIIFFDSVPMGEEKKVDHHLI